MRELGLTVVGGFCGCRLCSDSEISQLQVNMIAEELS